VSEANRFGNKRIRHTSPLGANSGDIQIESLTEYTLIGLPYLLSISITDCPKAAFPNSKIANVIIVNFIVFISSL
jgi:hypothetical protein